MSGQIHDLGYKRYAGTRKAQSTRWRVIAREQIANGWKKWWRYKLALGGAVITACIAGGIMFFAGEAGKTIRGFGNAAGELALSFTDGVAPLSIPWFCRMAFILSLTLGGTIVATDTQSGAFTFYYVRSVRPRDYVFGKVMGYGFLVATLMFIGPMLLTVLRLLLTENSDDLVSKLHLVPKMALVCGLATIVYTAVPLAISAVVPNRRYALALWAAFYLIVGGIATAVGALSDSPIAALDIQTSLQAVTLDLFDIRILRGHPNHLDPTIAIASLLAMGALAVGIIWFQVSRDQRAGVGGSS